ncbi:MAG: glucokinase [Burkholderiales bacterium]|nr:glucokinase [Burkholderiales bacterium]MDE2453480.1 glucokinase [Burkholderiales bacterium]
MAQNSTHRPVLAGLPWLVADIGGTNARFGWVGGPEPRVEHVIKLPVADYATPALAAREYLARLRGVLGARNPAPRRAAIAVATAVGEQIRFTNSPWQFSRKTLQAELGLEMLLVLNDFEALALSLPRLRPDQLRAHGKLPVPHGILAVIGPGTGLGVGGVVESRSGWVALPGEGGHVTLAANDDFEAQLLAAVRRDYEHVSAERLLSGIGLPVLHGALARVLGQAAAPASTEAIVASAVAGSDALCVRTMDLFCALLGGVAGNAALTMGARGGVFIGGGIVPRLGDGFFSSRFRERFEAKGRFRGYLEAIPTALITDTLAALSGAALAIEQE